MAKHGETGGEKGVQKTRATKLQLEIKATGLFPRSPEEEHIGVLFALPELSMAHISPHHHGLTSLSPLVLSAADHRRAGNVPHSFPMTGLGMLRLPVSFP